MSEGQQLGIGIANNFMLMTLFALLADSAGDPDGFLADIKKGLCDLADDYELSGIAPETAKEARAAAKQVIVGVLQNPKPLM